MKLSKILSKKAKTDTQSDLDMWMWQESIKRRVRLSKKLGKKK